MTRQELPQTPESKALRYQGAPERKRMIEAPIKLRRGDTIPIRSNDEIARMFEQEDVAHLETCIADANVLFPLLVQGHVAHDETDVQKIRVVPACTP